MDMELVKYWVDTHKTEFDNGWVKPNEVLASSLVVASYIGFLVKENTNSYPKVDNVIYCITLRKLADLDYVKDPVKLSKVDITDTHSVKLTFTNKFNYEIIETINCRETE